MNSLTTFYIVRHGESMGNLDFEMERASLKAGGAGTDLTTEGRKQSEEVAKKLRHVQFDAIFSSDLLRTKRTAEIIALERKLEITALEVLRERNFGKYVANTKELQDEMKPILEKLTDTEKMRYRHKPDMETQEEAAVRLLTFLRETALAYPGKTILVTNHGNTMRSLLIQLGFAKYNELPSRSILNTGYYVLQSDGVEFFLIDTHRVVFHKK